VLKGVELKVRRDQQPQGLRPSCGWS